MSRDPRGRFFPTRAAIAVLEMVFMRVLVLARSRFSGVEYLGAVFEELLAKLGTLLARFKKPEREYYPADYPDDWTL